PLTDQKIIIRIGIYQGATPTTLVYEEQHEVTTTATGLFTLAIGDGTAGTGTFTDISWGSDTHHLGIELDAGDGFINLGTFPFLSVPYALYAASSGSTTDSNDSSTFTLPFEGSVADEGQTALRVANTNSGDGFALTGTQGNGSSIEDVNRAAIWGSAETGHGVVGFSSGKSGEAGVWGNSNQAEGYGIYGSASAGGIGGLFETNGDTLGPALVTRGGPVGIGTENPEKQLHVNGDLFVNTSEGSLELGAPNNGDQWHIGSSTGEALIFSSKESGSDSGTPRIVMRQDGRIALGGLATPSGRLDIFHNSTANSAQLTLFESEDDFARLTFRNTGFRSWSIAGYNTSNIDAEQLNILHSTTGNIMTFDGNGNVGVRVDNPTARLHIGQRGQSVGRGLRFSDGTANEDWDITHGFSLRLHYGGELRGFFNANTGAYVQSSDGRMKQGAENLDQVLPQLKQLHPLTYRYRNARTSEKTIGFVAQEVSPLFPELVHYSEADDIYGIDYVGFSVVAIKAIQEQQIIIEAQQQSINTLLKRLETLEAKVLQTPNR
ncbi:MAG: tail fiber domain-containing protein, partial [Bacteroidota bacterium]